MNLLNFCDFAIKPGIHSIKLNTDKGGESTTKKL